MRVHRTLATFCIATIVAATSLLISCNKREIELEPIEYIEYEILYSGYMKKIEFVDQWHGMASATNGRMYTTADGGNTWNQVFSDIDYIIADFDYVTYDTAYMAIDEALGSNLFIYKSVDAGTTWSMQSGFVSNGFSFSFYDGLHGFASSGNTPFGYWRTTDGSMNWTLVSSSNYYAKVCAPEAYLAFGKDGNERLHRTYNGGASWQQVLGYGECKDFVVVMNVAKVFSTGNNGKVRRSDDNGMTWSVVLDDEDMTFTPIDADETGFVVCGGYGPLVYSRDFGATWNYRNLRNTTQDYDYRDIEIIDAHTIIALVYIDAYPKLVRITLP